MYTLNDDIMENIILHSSMEEVENLCLADKNIHSRCNDKRLLQMLIEKKDIKLFTDLNDINNYAEFNKAYQLYKHYEHKASKIIATSTLFDCYFFLELNNDPVLTEKVVALIYEYTYKESWPQYNVTEISNTVREILFDFNNDFLFLVYPTFVKYFIRSKERMLWLLAGILYYFPNVDIKLGFPFGGQGYQGTSIRKNARTGRELSVIKKNL